MSSGRDLLIFISIVLLSSTTYGAPNRYDKLLTHFQNNLDKISKQQNWVEFVESRRDMFPDPKKHPQWRAHFEKKVIEIDGEKFTVGIGFRQSVLKVPLKRLASVYDSPSLYQSIYEIDEVEIYQAPDNPQNFTLHIKKEVPIIKDQDFTNRYTSSYGPGRWHQRIRQVSDQNDFALRDGLKVIEATSEGLVLREVSMIYLRSWYLRAIAPKLQSFMKKELSKSSNLIRCVAENDQPIGEALVGWCRSQPGLTPAISKPHLGPRQRRRWMRRANKKANRKTS